MTKRREPLTYHHALTVIAARIGWDRCGAILGETERMVRYLSDPDCETEIRLLDAEEVDFEYDGEMQADMALDYELLRSTYPFCRLTGPANVLVMPGLHSAHISSRLMQSLGGVTVIGPVIDGLQKPVQVVQMGATVSDLVNHAALAAYGALSNGRR